MRLDWVAFVAWVSFAPFTSAGAQYGVFDARSPDLQIGRDQAPARGLDARHPCHAWPGRKLLPHSTTATPDRTFDEKGPHCWDWNDGLYLWRSADLQKWEALGRVWSLDTDATWQKEFAIRKPQRHGTGYLLDAKRRAVWAPELHYIKSATNWFLVACMNDTATQKGSFILRSRSGKPEGPYENIEGNRNGPIFDHIDGSLFEDDDGSVWFVGHNHFFARMKPDLSGLAEAPRRFLETSYDPEPYIEGAFLFKHGGNITWPTQSGHSGCRTEVSPTMRPRKNGRRTVVLRLRAGQRRTTGRTLRSAIHRGRWNRPQQLLRARDGSWFATHFGNPRGTSEFKQPFLCRPAIIPMRWEKTRFVVRGQD
jgi:hypothetical protein